MNNENKKNISDMKEDVSQEFVQKIFNKYNNKFSRSMELNPLLLLKEHIGNYKKLNDYHWKFIEQLNEEEKIIIIRLYDKIISELENILDL